MSKKRSSQSRHGPCGPPLTVNTWQPSSDEPFNCFSSGASSTPAFKARKTATGRVPAQSPDYSTMQVYDPEDFVRQSQTQFQSTLSPISPTYMRSRRNSSQNLSPSSCFSQSPLISASEASTDPTSISSIGMSRSDSLGGASFYGGLSMLKIDSQRSNTSVNTDRKVEDPSCSYSTIRPPTKVPISPNDSSLSLSHTGGVVETSPSSYQPSPDILRNPWINERNIGMSRTASGESTDSSKSRISRRSQEQALLGTRPIAPKDVAEPMSREGSSSSLDSDGGPRRSPDGSKIAIQKAKYQRPTHEKMKCIVCNDKPDGYRGPHELRRHMENRHSSNRKVWICIDISPNQTWLANCKQCRDKKQYGAYYNAACHLRRIHWNPREKGKKADKGGKGRGGNGGGDFPPMEELKKWMKEIPVAMTKDMPEMPEVSDESEDDAEEDFDDPAYSTQPSEPAPGPANPSTSQHLSALDVSPQTAVPSQPSFSLTIDREDLGKCDPATLSTLSTTYAGQENATVPPNPSINDNFAFGSIHEHDLSLHSSMNSLFGDLDQFYASFFEPDLFDSTQ